MENKDFNTTSYAEQVEAKKELILKMAEINADETKNKTNKQNFATKKAYFYAFNQFSLSKN